MKPFIQRNIQTYSALISIEELNMFETPLVIDTQNLKKNNKHLNEILQN